MQPKTFNNIWVVTIIILIIFAYLCINATATYYKCKNKCSEKEGFLFFKSYENRFCICYLEKRIALVDLKYPEPEFEALKDDIVKGNITVTESKKELV